MDAPNIDWESRISALWLSFDETSEADFIAQIEALSSERLPDDPIGLFERACAQDSTGHSDRAVPLYEAALAGGLLGIRRRRAVIQMASSLRNIGDFHQSIVLLEKELLNPSDELDGAVRGTLALALVSAGRDREAVSHALTALAHYLPRYNRSMARYAAALIDSESAD